eukprot:evm.model.scf_3526.2 EVM.evm.TU.scf_3526.2   scf_3526:11258-12613(+)
MRIGCLARLPRVTAVSLALKGVLGARILAAMVFLLPPSLQTPSTGCVKLCSALGSLGKTPGSSGTHPVNPPTRSGSDLAAGPAMGTDDHGTPGQREAASGGSLGIGVGVQDSGRSGRQMHLRRMARQQNMWRYSRPPEAEERKPTALPPWYSLVERNARARVDMLKQAGCQELSPQQLADLAQDWVEPGEPSVVTMVVRGETLFVRPMWLSLYQEEEDGSAEMYIGILPANPEYGKMLREAAVPVATVRGYRFKDSDAQCPGWNSYFVGLVGELGASPHNTLFPNYVFHKERVVRNVETFRHLASFLAEATREGIESHLKNLQIIKEERGYRDEWCYYTLRDRWGDAALKYHQIDI